MKAKYVIAIDPGTTESGVCIVKTEDYRPIWCKKVRNENLLGETLAALYDYSWVIPASDVVVVIERMQGNNMPVSSDVFLTCEWIGRFDILLQSVFKGKTNYLFRRDEYNALCSNLYTRNDSGIRQALVDRFAYGEKNFGKGTKQSPGFFYGFSKDTWSAMSIATTFIDTQKREEEQA